MQLYVSQIFLCSVLHSAAEATNVLRLCTNSSFHFSPWRSSSAAHPHHPQTRLPPPPPCPPPPPTTKASMASCSRASTQSRWRLARERSPSSSTQTRPPKTSRTSSSSARWVPITAPPSTA